MVADEPALSSNTFPGRATINEERIRKGKKSIGFANPALYKNPSTFNDMVVGNQLINEGLAKERAFPLLRAETLLLVSVVSVRPNILIYWLTSCLFHDWTKLVVWIAFCTYAVSLPPSLVTRTGT